MKYCSECGRKVKDDAEFCYVCGAPQPIADDAEYMERKAEYRKMRIYEEKRSRGTAAGNIGAALLLALIMFFMFMIWYSPARRAYTLALNGEKEAAEALYQEDVKGSTLEAFLMRMLIPRGASSIVKAYQGGKVVYEDALSRLTQFTEFESPLHNAERQAEKLKSLYVSAEAFTEAQKMEEQGDIRSALYAYRMVGSGDSRYEEAQSKVTELEGLYKAEIITSAGSPKTREEYEHAVAVINDGLEAIPGDVTLTDKLTTIRQSFAMTIKSQTIPKATEYISKGYYKEAIDLIQEALSYNEQDIELRTLLTTATGNYEDFARNQVGIYLDNKDPKGARAFLDRVSADLPDSTVIRQLYGRIK